VAAVAGRLEGRSDEELARLLHQAGRADVSVDEFRVQQVMRGATTAVAFGVVGLMVVRRPVLALVLALVGFVRGSAQVRTGVERAVAARATRLRLELTTVAQLLALHVRTGAGPMQAVQRFAARGRGVAADELRGVVASVRAGSRESEAFRRAAELSAAPEGARLHQLFATGVERGADLAAALLVIADDLRDARRDDVRRSAIRARAAMLVPTIGILAPVMLLFIAAPLPSIVLGNR
jgi:tight adherence protein C